MPKVSVIIPVYNVEKYLRQTLDCLVGQTLKDIEIICVDDGSNDSSLDILREYSNRDSRVKYIQQQNQYAGIARNNGLKIAQGEYVIFLDSDDIFDRTMLEKMSKKLDETNSDMVVCRCQWLMMANGEIKEFPYSIEEKFLPKKEVFSGSEIASNILQTFIGWPWDKMYRRDFVLKNKLEFQGLRHSNDTYFVLMSLMMAEKISVLDEVMVTYRIHNTSLANTRNKAPECFYLALKQMKSKMDELGIFEKFEQSFINYCLTFPLWHIRSVKNKKSKKIMIDYFTELLDEIVFDSYKKEYFYSVKEYKRAKKYRFLRRLFSIKNFSSKKVISLLGIRFCFEK